MVRKVNRGVSFVEVLIALAIFLVMMMPLVSTLISSMKTTTTGKELQYRNEYAQNLIESVKEVSIDVLDKPDTTYFTNMGSTGVSIKHATYTYDSTRADGSKVQYPYETYEILGKTYLGTERTEYSYLVEMSSKPYAEVQAAGGVNPNNLTSGVVEDLDKSKVALISATLANYDTPAYGALLTKKMSELRKKQEKDGNTYDPVKDVKEFEKDKGSRIINIAVSGKAETGYDVVCTLYYSDNCSKDSSETGKNISEVVGMVNYTPYSQHFDKLPNIYLMYNVGVYNGQYMDDYITYDLSRLEDEGTEVNVFVIETASNYSTDVTVANTGKDWLKGGSGGLYRKANGTVRDNAKIGMAVSATGLTTTKLSNLHIYHNMSLPLQSDYNTESEYNAAIAEWEKHSKNKEVKYDQIIADDVQKLFNSTTHLYKPLTNVTTLNKAMSGNRGLYVVKVWMQEGNQDADTLRKIDPVVQGTRGGSEID